MQKFLIDRKIPTRPSPPKERSEWVWERIDRKSPRVLPIPKIIDEYNNHMNGVDVGDQLRAAFASQHRIKGGGWQALLYNFLFGKSQ